MNILYLTFYFNPDIGPGSFRNTTLVNELSCQLTATDLIHVITTQPNRYDSYKPMASAYEEWYSGGCPISVQRITVPKHKSGLVGQVRAFWVYFWLVHRLTKNQKYDLVVASSSRLFTAFLGAQVGRRKRIPLFLDIRDLFREAIRDLLSHRGLLNRMANLVLNPLLWAVERYTFGYAYHINLVSEGFRSYFRSFPQATYSFFTNGIDKVFGSSTGVSERAFDKARTILYAGNIGEGQKLHEIIPQAAQQLGAGYRFLIIGDGGARQKLEAAIKANAITNVELRLPIDRDGLLLEYQNTDYLFVHLNDQDACKRVLPSKLFEYGATDKPIIAGVAGYAAAFIRDHLPNTILFNPGDVAGLTKQLQETPYQTQSRTEFKQRFQRQTINREMARQIRQLPKSGTSYESNASECSSK